MDVGVLLLVPLWDDLNVSVLFSLDLTSGVSGGVVPMGGPSHVIDLPLI